MSTPLQEKYPMARQSYEIKIQGVVQGVGFRPFIYRLAKKAGLAGSVKNTGVGVLITLLCRPDELTVFLNSIKKDLPPLARVLSVEWVKKALSSNPTDFLIQDSMTTPEIEALIPQDSAICPDCLHELCDKKNRRYRYPFINCTNCGPRFSIIDSLPYDRPNTSMKSFRLCNCCELEYHDPADRRFHAQPIGCWSCGPRLSYHIGQGIKIETDDSIKAAKDALGEGKVVAIKGLGGFHLAVNATNSKAIARLRQGKRRKSKPLAVMVKDLSIAHKLAYISTQEEKLLTSSQGPIVLLKKRFNNGLPNNLAPGISELGIMLPYTPLHYLLFTEEITTLVMTSGNQSSEPICIDNDEALVRLANIADFFLLHNREIVARLDDSVLRFVAGRPRILRRSRGYVPAPIQLPQDVGRLIACGADQKNTFCLTRGKQAFVSQHIGDLNTKNNLDFYRESIDHLQKVHEIIPEAVIYDSHPDYLSSRYGKNLYIAGADIQHHKAHAAAVMAEHGLTGPVIGVIFDGTGLGPDQTIWGGEILHIEQNSHQRLAHIDHLLLPGGEAATKEPWRMAIALLWMAHGESELTEDIICHYLSSLPRSDINFLLQMINKDINCPKTSSCGRLFDGVAALVNQRLTLEYEGQAAMELEALAWLAIGQASLPTLLNTYPGYEPTIGSTNGALTLDSLSLAINLLSDCKAGVAKEVIALKFHLWLINSVTKILLEVGQKIGRLPIVLSGGCMQNRLLLEGLWWTLSQHQFTIYAGENIPMNDGGISLGQALIGGEINVSRNTHAGH